MQANLPNDSNTDSISAALFKFKRYELEQNLIRHDKHQYKIYQYLFKISKKGSV